MGLAVNSSTPASAVPLTRSCAPTSPSRGEVTATRAAASLRTREAAASIHSVSP
jgi:hypothetical protein